MIDLAIARTEIPAQQSWPIYPRDRRTIAHHEAGHLTLSILFGLTTDRQTAAVTSDGTAGSVRRLDEHGNPRGKPGAVLELTGDPDDNPPEGFQRQCLGWGAMFLGGHAAEVLLHGQHKRITGWPAPLLTLTGMSATDLHNAAAFLSLGWPMRYTGPMRLAWLHAVDVLSANWAWVQRVAGEIDQTGECTDQRARELREARLQ